LVDFEHLEHYYKQGILRSGPAVAEYCDTYFLRSEPWLNTEAEPVAHVMSQNEIPWVRSGAGHILKESNARKYPAIYGPNVLFGNEQLPLEGKAYLDSPYAIILMLNDINVAQAMEINPDARVRIVHHFMRPELYTEPFKYEKIWDVLFLVRGGFNPQLRVDYPNHTALNNGWFTFEELKFKAQHSEVCMTSCVYESYGLSAHEINMFGCPVIGGPRSMRTPNWNDKMGVAVKNQEFYDWDETTNAINDARQMSRTDVRQAAIDFHDPDLLREIHRKAIYE
jgi:hypothetical protein